MRYPTITYWFDKRSPQGMATMVWACFLSWLMGSLTISLAVCQGADLPNILWVTSEDNGPQLGCYGDQYATTPHLDALAAKGMRYATCWSNAPVCAPARTAIISGVYPPSLGAQHMRSQVPLPPELRLYPQYLKSLGYYCTNNSKTDYNLDVPDDLWDESSNKAHWRNRAPGQPFFAVFNFTISHESKLRTRPHQWVHSPDEVPIPPYHPDTPEVRQDWAQYYDRLTEMDAQVGRILEQLDEDGLADSTIVFYYGDHGSGMPRGKRWLYESGLRVPLIVHVPERFQHLVEGQYEAGGVSRRLVSFVDLAPTLLSLAGKKPPEQWQGNAFLGPYATAEPRYLFGFRDRMDERYDMSRAVRDERFAYIRNFYPHRPQGAYLDYMFQTPTTQVWKKLFDAGELNDAQSFFWKPKPSEELYDLEQDPHQIHNLADDPQYADVLQRMRGALRAWMLDIYDLGFLPEGEMLARAGKDAPYTMGHDPQRYPVERYYAIADQASRSTPGDIANLLAHQDAPDSVVRFWVANGLLIRAVRDSDRQQAVAAARPMMDDPSPYVRVVSSEIVARFGAAQDRPHAIAQLVELADPRHENMFVALTALNSLDYCEPTREELGDRLRNIPAADPGVPKRYTGYIPRLLERIHSIAR